MKAGGTMAEHQPKAGQHFRDKQGNVFKVLRVGYRADLGLPTESAYGKIVPDDGNLCEYVQVHAEPRIGYMHWSWEPTKPPKAAR